MRWRPRMRSRACAWALLNVVLFCGTSAGADAPAEVGPAPGASEPADRAATGRGSETAPAEPATSASEPAGYIEAVDEAVREFAGHNYEEARALFARAHALYPNARTERGMGLVQFELRDYVESVQHFEAALRSPVKPLTPALKVDTERVLAKANAFVARVRVDAKPSAANVTLGGSPVDVPPGEALLLPIGEHTLEAKAPGFVSEKRKLRVLGGEERVLTLILTPDGSQAASARPALPTQSVAHKRWYQSPWLWTGVGVVVLAGAATGASSPWWSDGQPSAYGGTRHIVVKGP